MERGANELAGLTNVSWRLYQIWDRPTLCIGTIKLADCTLRILWRLVGNICDSFGTSATIHSSRATRATATRTSARRSCRGLRAAGVTDTEIETMTVANPRRLLTIG